MSALPLLERRGPARSGAPAPARSARPPLALVEPPRRTTRWTLVLVAVGTAGVFGLVWLNALVAQHAFAARALETEVEQLRLRYEELTADVAGLESPARVEQVALAELGMLPATDPGYLVVDGPVPGPPDRAGDAEAEGLVDAVKPTLAASR